jgi:lipid-binding SYLF domain-containing protein
MRVITVVTCCIWLSASAAGADIKGLEKTRLSEATAVLQARADTPEHEIPTDTAHSAACVIVMPSLKKAAFIVGGEFGKGVLTCRTAQGWSTPVFMQMQKGSIGFQAGAEEIDLVLLVMNRPGAEKLLGDKVTLGAGMSVAAGPEGGTASAATDARLKAEILSYSRTRGAFIGADISGGVLGPDKDANRRAYGDARTPQELIRGSIEPPADAADFLSAVQREFGGAIKTSN